MSKPRKRKKALPLNALKVAQLMERYMRQRARAKQLYKTSDIALDRILAIGVPLDQPIDVQFRDKKNIITRRLVVKDLFKETNTAFKSVSAHRFEVVEYKEPKPPKNVEPMEAAAAQ
jgi:hypothetical protein